VGIFIHCEKRRRGQGHCQSNYEKRGQRTLYIQYRGLTKNQWSRKGRIETYPKSPGQGKDGKKGFPQWTQGVRVRPKAKHEKKRGKGPHTKKAPCGSVEKKSAEIPGGVKWTEARRSGKNKKWGGEAKRLRAPKTAL